MRTDIITKLVCFFFGHAWQEQARLGFVGPGYVRVVCRRCGAWGYDIEEP